MKRQRLFLVTLAAAAALSVTGCGSGGDIAATTSARTATPERPLPAPQKVAPGSVPAVTTAPQTDVAPVEQDLGSVDRDLSGLDGELDEMGSDLESSQEGDVSE